MTDIWVKLWGGICDEGLEDLPDHENIECTVRWLRTVKEEGYKLNEKAEKWDLIDPERQGDLDSYITLHNKLEAINTAMKNAKDKDPSDRNMGRDFMYDVEEILEGEG